MNLFQSGEFKLHSGDISNFKIDCDALTDDDWQTLALLVRQMYPDYNSVYGVWSGGIKFEQALDALIDPQPTFSDKPNLLIVDDVLTTGQSMEDRRKLFMAVGENSYGYIRGVVLFARGKCPAWITPIFQLTKSPSSDILKP